MRLFFVGLTENSSMRGVERYCYEYVRKMSETRTDVEVTMLMGEWQEYYLPLKSQGVKLIQASCKNGKLSRHLYLIFLMRWITKGFDYIHYGNTLPYFFRNKGYTTIAIHDLAEYFVPHKYGRLQLIYRKLVARLAAFNADHVTTLSDYSRATICSKLGVPANKITRIYPGVDHLDGSNVTTIGMSDERYFLYYGAIERAKGIVAMLEAFVLAKSEESLDHDVRFYLVGKAANAMADIGKYLDRDDIRFLGFVGDEELVELISAAQAVVMLSEYEGFGLPAVESFLFNDNILASSTTSLGEVTAGFAWQCRPNDLKGIARCYCEMIEAPRSYDGHDRSVILGHYTWAGAVDALLGIYENQDKRYFK